MDKNELKKIIKPIIKECIREVLLEEGLKTLTGSQEFVKEEKIVENVASHGAIGVLWGNSARELSRYFSSERLIEGVHPSPLSAHRGFLGSRPFSRVNQILISDSSPPITW